MSVGLLCGGEIYIMDKAAFLQYNSLLQEIKQDILKVEKLQDEIALMSPDKEEVTDVVTTGKRGKKPISTKKIHGFESHSKINRKRAQLRKRIGLKNLHIARMEEQIGEVEEYIDSLQDSEMRRILKYRCIDNMDWQSVAEKMGAGYTAESCKQRFSRFLREK